LDIKERLLARLNVANPGWNEWQDLLYLVSSLDFEYLTSEFMGAFYRCGDTLVFSEVGTHLTWPDWMPAYVPALYGMKADNWEMAGGYADSFCNQLPSEGAVFSPAGNDELLGFPLIEVPDGTYAFQSNAHGATFFVSRELEVLYPHSGEKCFKVLDPLETFTRKCIQQALVGGYWSKAYPRLEYSLLD
jgi:hypothetical protein